VLGTSPASIDAAEDREQFNALCDRLGIPQPEGAMATTADGAVAVANSIGYPVLVRPSYVLGGRAMQIVYDAPSLETYFATAVQASEERPAVCSTSGHWSIWDESATGST